MAQEILPALIPFQPAGPAKLSTPSPAELESLVRRFGANSTSYVLLEGPKKYFTSTNVDGFIAYQLSGGVAVIGGDPVCDPGDAAELLKEFIDAMGKRKVCAYQVSPMMLDAFQHHGFDGVQIGKEAFFDLKQFTLAGGAMELVRAATNKARREGVVVTEHDPFAPGAGPVNSEILEISEEWLREKGDREMGFLLGGLGLDHKSEKRYFIARSGHGSGRIEGLIVCEPIFARRGYYLDVTRRRSDAIRGTMELLTSEIFRQLAAEGYETASMGLAPLASLDDPKLAEHPRLTNLMRFLYEHVDRTYDFKHLYRYKAKYRPHAWERRYLCFRPGICPRILYATLQVRDAFSLRELFRHRSSQLVPSRRTAFGAVWSDLESWKHAASFVIGLFYALLFWS
jgi:phosphatidylglycerol lysyltransferase